MTKQSVRKTPVRAWHAPALLAIAAGTSTAMGQTTLTWNTAANGAWNDPTRWTPNGIPNNSGPNTFNAVIGLAGAYTVNFNIDATIQNFTFNGNGAIMQLANNCDLTVNQNMTLGSELDGRKDVGGNGTVRVLGNLTFQNGGRLRHTTSMRVDGNITFANTSTDEICDTGVDHRGAAMNWSGSGNILLGRGAVIQLSTATTFMITSSAILGYNGLGTEGKVVNAGDIVKDSLGVTYFDHVVLNNLPTGKVYVIEGQLKFNNTMNVNAGALSGGRYRVENDAELSFVDASDATLAITRNEAAIELIGPNARFDSANSLQVNASTGEFILGEGRAFTTAGDFTNDGALTVGQAGDLAVSSFTVGSGSTLTNYNAGAQSLSGGTYNVAGLFQFENNGIREIAANVALDGASSAILNLQGTTAFNSDLTVASTGALAVRNRTFTTASDLTVDGTLTVGPAATVEVGTTLTNVNAGTLSGGTFDIEGTLKAGAAQSITTVDADVTFRGDSAQIQTASGADALADWTSIGDSGSFTLADSATYTTTSTSNFTVASSGLLSVEEGSEFIVRQGSTLTNFSNGVFSSGVFDIKGTLRAQNASIQQIDNQLTLVGDNSHIVDFNGNDAFAPLNKIGAPGRLTVRDRAFNVANDLVIDGELVISQTGPERAPANVFVSGDVSQTGVLTLEGGTFSVGGTYTNKGQIQGTGTISGTFNHQGTFTGGQVNMITMIGPVAVGESGQICLDLADLAGGAGVGYDQFIFAGAVSFGDGYAGTISINDATFQGQIGDYFRDVIIFENAPTGLFQQYDLYIEARGLFLKPVFEGNSMGFQVVEVPAPGAGAMLGLTALALRRRRR